MREAGDEPRPIWRRWVAVALVAWMALAVGGLLMAWRLAEILPPGMVPALGLGVFVAAPSVLMIWSFWTMLRDPMTGWIAPSALFAFAGALVPAWQPLLDAGMRLNFEAHRPTYDSIVAEAKGGRMALTPDPSGWIEGDRDGVRFRYNVARPGRVEFLWSRDPLFETGVRYDDAPCTPTPKLKCIARGRLLEGHYFHYWFIA
jgi:hypothetical protein